MRLYQLLTLWMLTVATLAGAAVQAAPLDIPQLAEISVDGDAADWDDRGTRIAALAPVTGAAPDAADAAATAAIAWDDAGLLVLFDVQDDTLSEHGARRGIERGDSVACRIANWSIHVAPGIDPGSPTMLAALFTADTHRLVSDAEAPIAAAARRRRSGYIVELRVPWALLKLQPVAGAELPFSLALSDRDGATTAQRLAWPPRQLVTPAADSHATLRLAAAPGEAPPVPAQADPFEAHPATALLALDARPDAYVFTGQTFPRFTATGAGTGRIATVAATFWNSRHEVAERADRSGRYGAVVTLTPHDGQPLMRYVTLFRPVQAVDWRATAMDVTLRLPEGLGVHPQIAAEQGDAISHWAEQQLIASLTRDPAAARLLARLYEAAPGEPPAIPGTLSRSAGIPHDMAWWARLHLAAEGKEPIALADPQPAAPAAEVKQGSASDAGFKPELIQQLETLVRQWNQADPTPTTFSVVRGGILVYSAAWGLQDRQPVRSTTPLHAGELAELVTAAVAMAAVESGVAGAQDPVGEAGLAAAMQPTVTHLLTHTSGLGALRDLPAMAPATVATWPDLPERLATAWPALAPGPYRHAAANYELLARLIERRTGRSIVELAHRRILQPLRAEQTTLVRAASELRTTAENLAAFGQMVLGGGVYGSQRILSESSIEALRPAARQGDAAPERGYALEPLPDHAAAAFGRWTPSGSLLLIDPDSQVIVTLVRPAPGKAYEAMTAALLKAVFENLTTADPQNDLSDFGEPFF